jgi:predicted metalloprotease
MKWKGRRESTNVVDSRGKKVICTGGAGVLLNFVGRRFGIKGILVMIAVVGVLWMTGLVDPNMFLGGSSTTQSAPYQASPAEQERFDFVSVVLADTEDVWKAEFARHGETYTEPQLERTFQAPGDFAQHYLDQGDIEEAMRAANAIGDDAIQGRTGGKVVPHSFTHGTSEQRMRWFNKGFRSGSIEGGDTFSMPYDAL